MSLLLLLRAAAPVSASYTGGGTINDGATGTTASLSVVIPVAASVGDVAVVHIHGNFVLPADDVTPPAGWTRITGPTASGAAADNAGLVFGKTLVSGEPGSTVTFTATAARRVSGTVTTFSNVDLSGVQFAALPDSTAGATADLPTVGSVAAGSVVIALFGRRSAVATTVTSMTVTGAYVAGPESRTSITTAGNILSRAAYLIAGTAGTYGGETTATTSPDTTTGVDFLLTLPVAVAGSTASTASGGITLGGTATASAAASAPGGSIILGGGTTAAAGGAAAGTIALGGAATAQAPTTAAGSITLGGTAAARAVAIAAGTISLGGTTAATAPAMAAGTVTLGGVPSATALTTAAGTITLSGTATAAGGSVPASASGTIALGGSATAQAAVTATGSIALGGLVTALVPASASGLIALSGLANAAAIDYLTHIYGAAVLVNNAGTAVLAGDGINTAVLAAEVLATAVATSTAGTAVLTPVILGTAVLTGDGTSTATVSGTPGTAVIQLT